MTGVNAIVTILNDAEREVMSFSVAVLRLYGERESAMAVHDWLEITGERTTSPNANPRYWRSITVLAAVRLAVRLCKAKQFRPHRAIG
jgi:hypothetical protein